jgi:NTE family protein
LPDPPKSILDSPAIGTGKRIEPCRRGAQPAKPVPPASGPEVGVTLSGGGFRATFAVLGMLRYLADAGLLSAVRYSSSVSGGSITNGLLARHWGALREKGFSVEAFDDLLLEPVVKLVSTRSLKRALLGSLWRTIGSDNRTDVLGQQLDSWFFHGQLLQDMDPEVRFVINAANIVTGVRFTFERDVVGDYVIGLAPTEGTGLRLAQAAAASAAVPGAFTPWPVQGISFPCAMETPKLLDGGVYDNTGLEVLDDDDDEHRRVFTVTMNAGGLLRPGSYGKVPLIRDLSRANALLYRQSTALRTRMMVAAFKRGRQIAPGAPLPEGSRRGVLVQLATDFKEDKGNLAAWRAAFEEARTWKGEDLAYVPTVFDRFDEALCRRLVYRGWWLTGAAMASYYPDMAPPPERLRPPPLPADRA